VQRRHGNPAARRHLADGQQGGPGEFNIVTLVEWATSEAIASVMAAETAEHQRIGFDRAATIARLGVRADLATYGRLEL
jgi:hypothetical protein